MSDPKWLSRDEFFLTLAEAAQLLQVESAEVMNLIKRHQLGAIFVDSNYRIPRPALESYLRRSQIALSAAPEAGGTSDAEFIRSLPPIVHRSRADLKALLLELEVENGMRTSEFIEKYRLDPDASGWTRRHHRWAAIAEALEPLQP